MNSIHLTLTLTIECEIKINVDMNFESFFGHFLKPYTNNITIKSAINREKRKVQTIDLFAALRHIIHSMHHTDYIAI